MAIKIEESIDIKCPAEAVFAYLSNVENDPKWQPSVVAAKMTSEGPPGVGSTGVHRVKFMGMTDEYGWEVTEFEEPKRIAWRLTSGPLTGRMSYAVDAGDDGATVAIQMEGEFHGLRRLLTPLAGPMGRKQTRDDLANLKKALESRA
jgi:uncharacterized membrane protein